MALLFRDPVCFSFAVSSCCGRDRGVGYPFFLISDPREQTITTGAVL